MASQQVKVLHHNVFEDGLTDAPAALSFSTSFSKRFTALLEVLCEDEQGNQMLGFTRARDFSQLPAVAPLKSSTSFFDVLDVLYSAIYHSIGGEARFGTSAPGEAPDLRMSLRSLYLRSTPTLEPVEDSEQYAVPISWEAPAFERELATAAALAPEADVGHAFAERVRQMQQEAFDRRKGQLSWKRKDVLGMWKRHNNILHDKWCKDLAIFMQPAAKPEAASALARFCRVRNVEQATEEEALQTLIEIELDGAGEVEVVKTHTLQAGVHWLLVQLCQHSLSNAGATAALQRFAGVAEVPAAAAQRAALVFPLLLAEMQQWMTEASLQERQLQVSATIDVEGPAIVSLVEFDEIWRRQPFTSSRNYVLVNGKGSASLAYDADVFDREDWLVGGSSWPPVAVRSEKARGVSTSERAPKSSCMLLLRRRSDGMLVLVVTVHLDSAPPSDTKNVALRGEQLRATLSEIDNAVRTVRSEGKECTVVLAGDFNALFEEFVHGNGNAFFETAAAMAVSPPLRRPVVSEAMPVVPPPDPAIARITEAGQRRLLVDAVHGGELVETTSSPDMVGGCTRAGTSMWIDFIFVGHTEGVALESRMQRVAKPEEEALASDPADGLKVAVQRWGSDHLPVACEITLSSVAT